MIQAIAKLDERLAVLKQHYTDATMPIESGHLFNLFEHVELALLSIAVLEKKLEKEVG